MPGALKVDAIECTEGNKIPKIDNVAVSVAEPSKYICNHCCQYPAPVEIDIYFQKVTFLLHIMCDCKLSPNWGVHLVRCTHPMLQDTCKRLGTLINYQAISNSYMLTR